MSESAVQELLAVSRRLLESIDRQDWAAYRELCDSTITAFEPEAVGHLEGSRMESTARMELALIDEIMQHPTAIPKQRAHALFRLLMGDGHDSVRGVLTDSRLCSVPGSPQETH